MENQFIRKIFQIDFQYSNQNFLTNFKKTQIGKFPPFENLTNSNSKNSPVLKIRKNRIVKIRKSHMLYHKDQFCI